MAIGEIHRYDIGTAFDVEIHDEADDVVNISGATILYMFFQKPTETILTKSANYITDGTDGQIRYVTQEGDLDEAGLWRLQSYISLPTGKWYSDVTTFKVYENIRKI